MLLKSIHLLDHGASPGTGAGAIVAIFMGALEEESGENRGQALGSILGCWDSHSALLCFVDVCSSLRDHEVSVFLSVPLRGKVDERSFPFYR